jgi:hypothetical protein
MIKVDILEEILIKELVKIIFNYADIFSISTNILSANTNEYKQYTNTEEIKINPCINITVNNIETNITSVIDINKLFIYGLFAANEKYIVAYTHLFNLVAINRINNTYIPTSLIYSNYNTSVFLNDDKIVTVNNENISFFEFKSSVTSHKIYKNIYDAIVMDGNIIYTINIDSNNITLDMTHIYNDGELPLLRSNKRIKYESNSNYKLSKLKIKANKYIPKIVDNIMFLICTIYKNTYTNIILPGKYINYELILIKICLKNYEIISICSFDEKSIKPKEIIAIDGFRIYSHRYVYELKFND